MKKLALFGYILSSTLSLVFIYFREMEMAIIALGYAIKFNQHMLRADILDNKNKKETT